MLFSFHGFVFLVCFTSNKALSAVSFFRHSWNWKKKKIDQLSQINEIQYNTQWKKNKEPISILLTHIMELVRLGRMHSGYWKDRHKFSIDTHMWLHISLHFYRRHLFYYLRFEKKNLNATKGEQKKKIKEKMPQLTHKKEIENNFFFYFWNEFKKWDRVKLYIR